MNDSQSYHILAMILFLEEIGDFTYHQWLGYVRNLAMEEEIANVETMSAD